MSSSEDEQLNEVSDASESESETESLNNDNEENRVNILPVANCIIPVKSTSTITVY